MEKDINKSESRRKFLKTAGKFAVYTPPVLMMMSKPDGVWAISTMNNGCGNGDQGAPGNSLFNNNAENSTRGPNCPNGVNNPN